MTESAADPAEVQSVGTLPRIGITMGDAAGIGPEIILKALADKSLNKFCKPIVIGDAAVLQQAARITGSRAGSSGSNAFALEALNGIKIVDLRNLADGTKFGEETAATGRASAEYIEMAVAMWRDGKIDAIATAPISKKALALGGYDFPGHTEFLAHLTGTDEFAMSFFAEKLRVVLLSTHVSLRNAIDLVKKEPLVSLIRFADKNLSRLLGRKVKIAVAGINPHASENGLFGDEEAAEIFPAIDECRRLYGIDVTGPFSSDTIFLRGFRGEFDAVIACYHDQATIAVKSLSFGSAVNVTLGLPLVRTSVDHGTALDIAGKGIADEGSMKSAIKLAADLVSRPNLS